MASRKKSKGSSLSEILEGLKHRSASRLVTIPEHELLPHKSIVVWPLEVSCGNADNSSVDTHRDKLAAEAVCRGIMREGLGGMGQIFPISVRVEPV
jgi:hypothetical protein